MIRPKFLMFTAPEEPGGAPTEDKPEVTEGKAEDKPEVTEGKAEKPLGEPGLRALQAERERASKAEKAAREAQAALDIERNAAATARAEADAAKAQILRYEVAVATDLPIALAGRLQGATREELEADAKVLKSCMTVEDKFIPSVDPSQGLDRGGSSRGTVASGRETYRNEKRNGR